MVGLIRLLRVKKETIYRVFSITDPGLVTFLMKMMNQMKQFKHNSFSAREPEFRAGFESQKDFGLARYNLLLYSIKKTTPGNFYARNEKERQKNASEKVIMRKLRIFKLRSAFDSITFSRDFLDSVDEVLAIFDRISSNQIFGILDEKYYQTGATEFKLPHWFKQTSLHSFSSWVVAHFEKRIYLCFKEGEPAYENKMPIQLRDDYLSVWNSLQEAQKTEIIAKVINKLDHYRREAFGPQELVPNFKDLKGIAKHRDCRGSPVIKNMHWDEIMFKLIWMLNRDIYDWKDLPLAELKAHIQDKIIRTCKSGASSFIFSCVAPNLVDSMKIERYFMNLMVQYLHDLYIQRNIDELTLEEEQKGKGKKKSKKKKKRNKKRKKNKGKTNEKKEEEVAKEEEPENNKEEKGQVTVELVKHDTLGRGNRDEFMMKLRLKIQREGDKKGLLVPLLHSEERPTEGAEKRESAEKEDSKPTPLAQKPEPVKKNELSVEIVTEKMKTKQERAKLLCEKIHQIFMQKGKKRQKTNIKDTSSVHGQNEKKAEDSNTVEEGSEHLYQSVRTTGMEGFWEDSKGTILEGDSFFMMKKRASDKDPQSDRGQGLGSKGGFSFGCRSENRRDRFTEESRSEGSKKMSRKINSVGKSLLELDTLKIEEEIEQEKELASPKFEIIVPLKPVVKKEEKKEKGREKTRSKKESLELAGEKGSAKEKAEEDPVIVMTQPKKKPRKSRSLCEIVEKKEKKEMDPAEKLEKQKKKKKMKYKLKKSKKDRKRRNEKKDQVKQEAEINSRKQEPTANAKKPLLIQRKGYPKKSEVKEEPKKPAVKAKTPLRGKMQKWEESEPEEKPEKKKMVKSVTKEKPQKPVTQKKKKVEKKVKPNKPGKWTQQEKKPLHMVKKKKSLHSKSMAFVPGQKKKLKKPNQNQNRNTPMPPVPSSGRGPNVFGSYMNSGMMMSQANLETRGMSYEHVDTEVGWSSGLMGKSVPKQVSGSGLKPEKESLKSDSQMRKAKQKSHEEVSLGALNKPGLTKSQEFFSKREIPKIESSPKPSEPFSENLQARRDSKETEVQKLGRLIQEQKEKINELTQDAFSSFVGDQVKKVVADLKSQAEVLNTHRQIILNRINFIVHKSFKTTEVNVYPYGSFETGLLTPFSDLDLAISFNTIAPTTLEEKRSILDTLENNLRLFSFVKESKKVLTASVPVIKIKADASIEYPGSVEKASESRIIKVDIIVGSYEENGDMSPAFRTTDFIKKCITYYPSFFDVVLFFKFSLASNKLANAFSGGLNAYGLSILYVAFLVSNSLQNCAEIGFLALKFLRFLTYQFDPRTMGVRLNYNEIPIRQPFVPLNTLKMCAHLVIVDPTSRLVKNVTPSCYRVFQVLGCFRDGFIRMQNACNFMEHKLLRKLEETLNRNVSEENRMKVLPVDPQTLSKSHLSNSIPANRFSLHDKTQNSLFLSNLNLSTPNNVRPNMFHYPSEVLSQDFQQKSSNQIPSSNFGPTPIPREPAKSLKTKSEIKFSHSNTTSPQSKAEEKTEVSQERAGATLKQKQRKGREVQAQLKNLGGFKLCREDLLNFFKDTYAEIMESSFRLNGRNGEEVSNCESVVHEKLQTDMNFDAQRKSSLLTSVEQHLETKSECGDLRKTKAPPDSTQGQQKKPKDDLPCKNSPLPKDPTTSKSACKTNNLMKASEDPIATVDSLEIDEPMRKRKNSIMSFGNESQAISRGESEKDFGLKRKNSLDQVHK